MAKLTQEIELFQMTEKQKKLLMKQGMTKREALLTIQQQLAEKLPETMSVGIENDHICIRKNKPTNIGDTITRAFGGKDQALKMLDNIKKGAFNFTHGHDGEGSGKDTTSSGGEADGTDQGTENG